MTAAFHAYCVVALVSSGRHCCRVYFGYDSGFSRLLRGGASVFRSTLLLRVLSVSHRSLATSGGVASSVLPQLTACPMAALAVLTHSLTHLLTHLPTYLPTCLPTYLLPTYYLPAYLLIYLLALPYLLIYCVSQCLSV